MNVTPKSPFLSTTVCERSGVSVWNVSGGPLDRARNGASVRTWPIVGEGSLLISRFQNPKPRLPNDLRVYAIVTWSRIDVDLERFPIAQSVQAFLGDYIDRESHSCDILDLLIDRRKRDMLVCLKGNQEAYVIRVLGNPSLRSRWREFGGDSTLLSYGVVSPMTENQHELEA